MAAGDRRNSHHRRRRFGFDFRLCGFVHSFTEAARRTERTKPVWRTNQLDVWHHETAFERKSQRCNGLRANMFTGTFGQFVPKKLLGWRKMVDADTAGERNKYAGGIPRLFAKPSATK